MLAHKSRTFLQDFSSPPCIMGNTKPVTNNKLRDNIHCKLFGCQCMHMVSHCHAQVQIGFMIDVSVQHAHRRKLLSNAPYC